ncbi:MAG: DUF559 domain-containing protein [Alphaproteobacteria bacterium]|nr:DUF559 domain-containing protein [Alphaproteobacteria bacterium]
MSTAQAQHLRRNLTGPERKLWAALKRLRSEGFHLRRQVPFDTYVLDFASHRERLVIEVDGNQHAELHRRRHDEARTRVIEARGYVVLRYTNYQVLQNVDGVMTDIVANLKKRRRIKFTSMPAFVAAELPPPDPAAPYRPPRRGGGRT